MDYIELNIKLSPRTPWAEIIVAHLAELGFDSFVDTEEGVQAYIPKNDYSDNLVDLGDILTDEVEFELIENLIPHQNWNAVWESDFHPVEVEEYLTIVAPFHDKSDKKGMIVEIQPQMSFGTGHHQTTWLMSKALFELENVPNKVLDMGTGTGVLAIVAEKLGATELLAIDIEDWSAENAIENAKRNLCEKINVYCGDVDLINGKKFDLIIANINKNVLKSHMKEYVDVLEHEGILLLSGFFETDVEEMSNFVEGYGLKLEKVLTKETWAGLKFKK